jgi:hypothetical protein
MAGPAICQEHAEIGFEALRRPFGEPSEKHEIVAHGSAGLHPERYEDAVYICPWARRACIFPADFARRWPWNLKTETSHRGVRILKARGPKSASMPC